MTTVGVIGLGRMGSQMAARLLDAEFDVVGFDIQEEPVRRVKEQGGVGAVSPGEVAEKSRVIVTSLPSPAIIEEVFCGDEGLLAGATGELTVLETSTSNPDTTTALADVAAEEGVQVVDGPVSGGPESARAGTLTVMLGAENGDLDAATESVVDSLGESVYYLGPVGAGHTTKLVNNVMTNGNRVLAMEAMTLGATQGVDLEQLYEVVSHSSGSSNQFEKRMPRVLNRTFDKGYAVDLARKDVKLALELANERTYPMMITSLVHELLTEASANGYGDEDPSAVVKLFEKTSGAVVESENPMDETFAGY